MVHKPLANQNVPSYETEVCPMSEKGTKNIYQTDFGIHAQMRHLKTNQIQDSKWMTLANRYPNLFLPQ